MNEQKEFEMFSDVWKLHSKYRKLEKTNETLNCMRREAGEILRMYDSSLTRDFIKAIFDNCSKGTEMNSGGKR